MSHGKTVKVVHLYPNEMNIYGDWGNVLTIIRRLQWHGYEPELYTYHPGKELPKDADILIGGGGQDSGQLKVEADLQRINQQLHELADDNVPMLMICGLYQLFGRFFKSQDGSVLKGIGLFDAETTAGPTRLIGNVVIRTEFGDIVGYENHSGLTTLDNPSTAFGRVSKGAGNNGHDGTEGARYRNVIGSYLHGSLLPKNPRLADALVEMAVTHRYGEFSPHVIDDRFAESARQVAENRPR
jgi:lipid II isoglutaminyl synthase (glutamine-hydrolysing)